MASSRAPGILTRRIIKSAPKQQRRWLSLHEYQSQDLLRQYNVPTPLGTSAATPKAARQFVSELGGPAVLKPQLLRDALGQGLFDNGLEGGIHRAQNAKDAEALGYKMLGRKVKTNDRIDEGLTVKRVYISEAVSTVEEWCLSMTIDRENYAPAISIGKRGVATAQEVANEPVERVHFKASEGITPEVCQQVADHMQLPSEKRHQLKTILSGMYNIFTEREATNLEISPLARLADGSLTCVGSRFTFDDAASKRQKELFALRDVEHEVPDEVEAEKHGLVYVRMDGNIGNVVNGAGLAMATNDAIGFYGGKSANFLDAGGQATKETMVQAFSIVLRDERVKTILVNVYGGITNCAMIAESIIAAAAELGPLRVPVVVRLQGTNSPQGLKLLEETDLGLHVEADFGAAAEKAVQLAKLAS